MKQPIWVRERTPPAPPSISFLPARRKQRQETHYRRGGLRLVGGAPRLLSQVRKEYDPALIEAVLMQYRLVILVFSVWIFKR